MINERVKNIVLVTFILFVLFIFLVFIIYKNSTGKLYRLEESLDFKITQGQNINEIAQNLKEEGVIGSPLIFKIYLKLNNMDKNIQAGVYIIPQDISIKKLALILQHGRDDITLRYIEGWRIEELAMEVDAKFTDIDYKTFLLKARKYEGELFPDTYYFNKNSTSDDIIEELKRTYDYKTKDILSEENLRNIELTRQQAIILASIVEREAFNPKDRKLIAGILIKRFKEEMKLEADATTQYAVALQKFCAQSSDSDCLQGENGDLLQGIKWWPTNLTKDDLAYDSPYNTRKNLGLPPAPIASYSLDSLEAVVNYTKSDYYFYMTDSSGDTYYAVTNAQHEANVAEHLN